MSKFIEFCKRYPRWNKPIDFEIAAAHSKRDNTSRAPGRKAMRRRLVELQEEIHATNEQDVNPSRDIRKFITAESSLGTLFIGHDCYDLFIGCYR